MSAEDALFRVMVPVADRFVEARRKEGQPIDPAAIAEATLQAFAASIVLGEHTAPLCERLVVHLGRHRRTE